MAGLYYLILALYCIQIQDDGMPNAEYQDVSKKQKDGHDDVMFPAERQSQERVSDTNAPPNHEVSLPFLKATPVFVFQNKCIYVLRFPLICEV